MPMVDFTDISELKINKTCIRECTRSLRLSDLLLLLLLQLDAARTCRPFLG